MKDNESRQLSQIIVTPPPHTHTQSTHKSVCNIQLNVIDEKSMKHWT